MKYWTTLQKLMWLKRVSGGSQEYEGDIVSFNTPTAKKLKNLIVSLSPIQEGTGDPTPENIRPITGRTSASAWRTGKNLYSRENSEYNVPYYNQDGTQTSYEDVAVWWFKAKPNTKYTCSVKETPSKTTYLRWINCDADKGFISRPVSAYSDSQFPITITTPADTGWVQIAVNEYNAAQVASNDWQIQIEESETATDYEAYQGNLFSVDWTDEAGTVYSGTVDIVTGELRVRPEYPSYNGETLLGEWMSSMDKYVAGTTPTTGAQVVDLGGTETIYHLTPQEIMSLVGQNVVWSPDGSVTVRV